MAEVELEAIPLLAIDDKVKNMIKDSEFDLMCADGKLYYDTGNGKTKAANKLDTKTGKDVDKLTESLFGQNFQPQYWSNEESVEYVLDAYEFNLTRAFVLCPFEAIRFKFIDEQLRVKILFEDIKPKTHKQPWLLVVFVNFVFAVGYVAWTNNLLS